MKNKLSSFSLDVRGGSGGPESHTPQTAMFPIANNSVKKLFYNKKTLMAPQSPVLDCGPKVQLWIRLCWMFLTISSNLGVANNAHKPWNGSLFVPQDGAEEKQGWRQGRTRGAIAPRRSMLAPRRKVKHDFFGDFWHL